MVAVAQFILRDPEQKESVLAVLREHSELQPMILHAIEKAEEISSEVRITLDTVQYDDWDPPVTMTIWINEPWDQFLTAMDRFSYWLAYETDHNKELLFVMPMWDGPLKSVR